MAKSGVRDFFRPLASMDFSLLLLTVLLTGAGVLFIFGTEQAVYGATHQGGGFFRHKWSMQLIWIAVGMVIHFGVVCLDYRRLARFSWLFYLAGVGLLTAVLVMGRTIHGAQSWIVIPLPVFGEFTIQPAEFAKPATLLFMAWAASRLRTGMQYGLDWLVLISAGVLPTALVCLQPDWGTALVFVPLMAVVIFVAGVRWKWLLVTAALAVLTAPLLYSAALEPHQRERLLTFFNASDQASGAGWNAQQSLLAVGSGGFWGKGLMNGTQHVLGFLPSTVAPTDFIFSVVAEETGFVGGGAMICAFLGIMLCCLRAAARAPDNLGTYICVAVGTMLLVHVYINIGMTVGLSPIIGIPLPLVSYGGSFMWAVLIALGLVQNVYARSGVQ